MLLPSCRQQRDEAMNKENQEAETEQREKCLKFTDRLSVVSQRAGTLHIKVEDVKISHCVKQLQRSAKFHRANISVNVQLRTLSPAGLCLLVFLSSLIFKWL